MVSIKDVAQTAGVSPSTVSHVINKTRYVSPSTTRRVERAIDQLGFHPSTLARALKMNRTNNLGMLVSSSTNPFFAEVVRGVEEGCYQNNFSLILCNSGNEIDRQLDNLTTLVQKRIDALVVMTNRSEEKFNEALQKVKGLPKVVLDSAPQEHACTLQDDSVLGGRLATNHLLSCGLKKIGCLKGPEGHPRSIDRHRGYLEAMSAADLPVNAEWSASGPLTVSGGYKAMSQILERGQMPEAIFAFNDLMAIGAYHAIQERGLRIPEDISVMGYDDIEYAGYMTPTLTTIKQPSFELGLEAARTLIDHLDNKVDMPPVIQLVPELVIRQSVRK
ncbi:MULTISPECIES: LacI family DNA-binding transcriptional regulator [Pseudovibrio]|uniref:LacI family DNA-binding transcriptional regulator n=1 Tax=Stappiaceae TaxID=2821832 RepID=UPI002366555C|nr:MULTISPECIES: substrate-binding domain-containing protein [Pseudovibrio]MDD7910835.1 substrate-binding domain-containing protein [Pseudovibrio exalbescens]MDX5593456.1 substrate-binding domain-containing protein [Pseudovibrio sp. SPO723]